MKPNHYEMSGGGMSVNFAPDTFSGQPLIEYKESGANEVFRGRAVRIVSSEIGMLVTVTLSRSETLTLLIPDIDLSRNDDHRNFVGEAIKTDHNGVPQRYRVTQLNGTARILVP